MKSFYNAHKLFCWLITIIINTMLYNHHNFYVFQNWVVLSKNLIQKRRNLLPPRLGGCRAKEGGSASRRKST